MAAGAGGTGRAGHGGSAGDALSSWLCRRQARPGRGGAAVQHTRVCTHMNVHTRVNTLGPERLGLVMEKGRWQGDLVPHTGPRAAGVHRQFWQNPECSSPGWQRWQGGIEPCHPTQAGGSPRAGWSPDSADSEHPTGDAGWDGPGQGQGRGTGPCLTQQRGTQSPPSRGIHGWWGLTSPINRMGAGQRLHAQPCPSCASLPHGSRPRAQDLHGEAPAS